MHARKRIETGIEDFSLYWHTYEFLPQVTVAQDWVEQQKSNLQRLESETLRNCTKIHWHYKLRNMAKTCKADVLCLGCEKPAHSVDVNDSLHFVLHVCCRARCDPLKRHGPKPCKRKERGRNLIEIPYKGPTHRFISFFRKNSGALSGAF